MTQKGFARVHATLDDGAVTINGDKSTRGFEEADAERYQTLEVYRKKEEDFVCGKDYVEYFDGLRYEEAERIFRGPLEARHQRKFTYVDRDVEEGAVYAYWMGEAGSEPTGPVAVKIRNPELCWSEAKLREALAALQERFPDQVVVESIGRTVQGREIPAIRAGRAERCLALVGYIHAGESGTELILPVLERLLANAPELLAGTSILAIPCVNLDKRERLARGVPWYLRENANGVDLNRNFPADWDTVDDAYGMLSSEPRSQTYRGLAPASEPETQAVMQYLREHRPGFVYAFHCLAGLCGPAFIVAKCAQEDTAFAETLTPFVTHYGKGMIPGFTAEENVHFACSSGSLSAWCYRQLGIPAVDLEMTNMDAEAEFLLACQTDTTDVAMLEEYRNRHVAGLSAVLKSLGL